MSLSLFNHRWVAGKSGRTLLLLHGTGGDENDLIPLGETIDPEANLLSVRGRVDENGSNRFFRRFAEGVFDYENMKSETAALATWLKEASASLGFDPEQVVLGVGIHSMRERLEAFGGTVKIKSVPGKGTTVLASLKQSVKAKQLPPISQPLVLNTIKQPTPDTTSSAGTRIA